MEELPPVESFRPSSSKNDTPNKFWSSVEPYCSSFSEEDLKVIMTKFTLIVATIGIWSFASINYQLIEDLIAGYNDDEEYLKIPPLGRHYTRRWAEDDLHQEQREGSRFGDKKKTAANSATANDDAQRMMDLATRNRFVLLCSVHLDIAISKDH